MNVILKKFRQNKSDDDRLTPNMMYCCVYAEDGSGLIISATMEYVAKAIQVRGYRVVGVEP